MPINNKYSANLDIANVQVLWTILGWIDAGLIWGVHIAIPCAPDSLAGNTRRAPTDAEQRYRDRLIGHTCRIIDAAALRRLVTVV